MSFHFSYNPELGINYSNKVFKRLSFSFDNSPVLK